MKKRTAYFGVIGGAALLAAAFAVVRFAGDNRLETAGAQQVSAAEARAIGARWRAEKTDELGAAYAQALIGAGLYDELLTEIAERGLFANDETSSSIFRAEASLRQGRFDEAMSAAGAGENPYLAYARARASYALTGDGGGVTKDVSTALRGPQALAGEAWLFRARVALDVNEFNGAEAAARRALEAGAAPARVELIGIEKAVRAGDLRTAAEKLEARSRRLRGVVDPEDFRLAAMIKLRAGEAGGAVRLIDRQRGAATEYARARLVAALAKRLVGDDAQAWTLVSSHLASAPKDWAGLDLAAAIARDLGRNEDADRLLVRLAKERPALAVVRKVQAGEASPDAIFEKLIAIEGDFSTKGAASALLGPGVSIRGIEEARSGEFAIIDLASAISANDQRRMRTGALSILKGKSSPLALALAGSAFIALDDAANARRSLTLSSEAAPDFLAPVLLRADLHVREGAYADAAALLREFLTRHESDDRARLALAKIEAGSGDAGLASASFAAMPPKEVFALEETAVLYGQAAKAAGGEALAAMLKSARANAPSARILGSALAAAGDDPGAAEALKKAVIAEPGDDELARRYFEIMTALGRAGEAQSLVDEIGRRRNRDAGPGEPDTGSDPRKSGDSRVNIRQ